jgi:hypothetical protein
MSPSSLFDTNQQGGLLNLFLVCNAAALRRRAGRAVQNGLQSGEKIPCDFKRLFESDV